MAEENNKQRPVRKLTVDNFSVIKHAELEFGKITVLIGPHASGKSLLCKLTHFLEQEVIAISEWPIQQQKSPDFFEFEKEVKSSFEKRFPRSGWGPDPWRISYESEDYQVEISSGTTQSADLVTSFGKRFRTLYEDQSEIGYPEAISQLRNLRGRGVWDRVTYIPSERTYFVDTNQGYRLLASEPDPLVSGFAALYASSLNQIYPRRRLEHFLKGRLLPGGDRPLFAYADGRTLPLNTLSSGGKELLPLFSVLEMYESQRPSSVLSNSAGSRTPALMVDDFFIEEPEAQIFPDMQRELVNYFAELAKSDRLRAHFTITTHSPYILTSFNNLIEAGQAARNNPKLHDQVAKIIPEQYWIKEGDFKAYAIEDGNLKSILNESGFIEGNYLDQVSEVIGDEFDKLLRLEYEHTKAS